MTTYIDFVPSNVAPFQFQPVLDGNTYNCVVTWNVFGRRYYVSCYALDGTLKFSVPMIGSPGGLTIETLAWDSGTVTAATAEPHGYVVGQTVQVTIAGANPNAYNGVIDALVLDQFTFSWPLAGDPGPTVSPGGAFRNVSLSAGYFDSTLVFRQANQQFEVSP